MIGHDKKRAQSNKDPQVAQKARALLGAQRNKGLQEVRGLEVHEEHKGIEMHWGRIRSKKAQRSTGEAEEQRFITSTVEQRSKGGKNTTKKRRNGRMGKSRLEEERGGEERKIA